MSVSYGLRRLRRAQAFIASMVFLGSLGTANADPDESADQPHAHSLDPVLVTAEALHGPQSAPSQGSLVATQPQSIVGAEFIQNNEAPAANYTDIIKFTPSVWTVDPNGPGLMENLGTSIRGFVDGQFNVTLRSEAPAANYTDIIKFTPSVWTVDPNGPGLMENLGTSIRGFVDGQFNVTL